MADPSPGPTGTAGEPSERVALFLDDVAAELEDSVLQHRAEMSNLARAYAASIRAAAAGAAPADDRMLDEVVFDGCEHIEDGICAECYAAAQRRIGGAAPADGPTREQAQKWALQKWHDAWGGTMDSCGPSVIHEIAGRCFDMARAGAAPASPAVREAAARVLVQMPTRPEPDPDTGEYPLAYLSVTAPIWDALDVLRAALAESVEEQQ